MNDEIKEILDGWKLGIEKGIDKNGIYVGGLCYSWEQLSLLLDYITNLQQENERLKELDENYPIEEQLEEALKYENIYKSRCVKAIEYNKEIVNNYLEEDNCEYCDGRYATANHNLNILESKGE